ncbi:MAG: DNA polymerase I [Candidatus Caccovivens sp.]
MDKFIIVDGNSLANRAFYAMPYLTNRKKQPSGAVFGFANLLVKLIVEQRPKFLAVAFDHARKTFRNDLFADYKGTRKETPPDLRAQFPIIKEMLLCLGVKVFEVSGIEADDIIGTLAKNSNCQNILVSGDRDLLQLIDNHTEVWLTRKGVTEIEKYDETYLYEKYNFSPSGIIDLKALMGDASDNIPGVAGVGEKTALSLLHSYSTLDGVYENLQNISGKLQEKLADGKANAYMSKQLATIKTDCEIEFSLDDCIYSFPFSQKVKDFFDEWDFRSLTNRKDLFAEGVRSSNIVAKRSALQTLDDVEKLKLQSNNYFCFDIEKLEFAGTANEVFYLKKELDLFSMAESLSVNDVLLSLKSIFEDENIIKITYSSKNDYKILKKLGIGFVNFFDIDIASYVLYAGLPKKEKVELVDYINTKNQLDELLDKECVRDIYEKVEIPLAKVLADMEEEGFKIDGKVLQSLADKYNELLTNLTEKIYSLAGEEFNINSPKQVAHILFDKLGLKAFNNKKQSTNFAVLDDIRWQHEIVDKIISYRKTSKLVSTYINVYQNIEKTSGDVIHTVFNQTLTSTGRLSSSEPNMQNIPTREEEGKNLRKIFISKYPDGQIISADYSQIELRLLANMAHEDSMIEAYNQGIDIHTKTASEIFGVPVTEVTPSQRREAKAVNFGIIYGISDFGLSQNIKTSVSNAKHYIESYFDRYPKIKEFMDKNVEFAHENGFVRSYFGRIRHIPEVKSSNMNIRKFGDRVAMNMPLQGTASDIIKMAMVKIAERLKNMKSHMILQIHDELIIDAPSQEVEEIKNILKSCMESVCDFVVPLTVSVSSGHNLFECK